MTKIKTAARHLAAGLAAITLAAGMMALAGTVARAATCTQNAPVTHGDGWAQAKIIQSCSEPMWVWARFHSSPSYTEYGTHRVAPPDAPKYSVAGSGSGDGWGTPYTGGTCRWTASSTRKCRTTFGGGPPPDSVHTTALVRSAKRCTQGVIAYGTHASPPSTIDAYWTSNDCNQFESPELLDNGGGIHYGDSWRTGVGSQYTSVASSPNAMSKAWNRYKNTSGGQIYCHRVYPTQGSSWFKANGSVC